MPNHLEPSLMQRVADEARGAFESSADPKYSFGPDEAVETLFALLAYRHEFPNLEGVGESILRGLHAHANTGDLTILLVKLEAFAMLLLQLIDPKKHEDLWDKLSKETPPRKPSLASLLKNDGLAFATNATLNSLPEDLRGKPRFAEYVSRVYHRRNPEAHEAHKLTAKARAEIFESICVFLLFAVSEYRERIETALFVALHGKFLEKVITRFECWGQGFVALQATERKLNPLQNIDPLAHTRSPAVSPPPRLSGPAGSPAISENQPCPVPLISDVIKQHARVVLLGEPGAGKTTSLQYLAWRCASELVAQRSPSTPLPVYVALKYYDRETGKTLNGILRQELGLSSDEVDRFLDANVLLLLDGLNEVRHGQQAHVEIEIMNWLSCHASLKVVLTTRPAAFNGGLERATCFEVRRLSDEQMEEFLGRSFSDASQLSAFVQLLKGQRKLWEWGRNPLHLAMLASVGLHQGGELPSNRGKLVQSFVQGILGRERLQGAGPTHEASKANLLACLAFEAVSEGRGSWGVFEALQRLRSASERLATHIDIPKFIEEATDNSLLVRTEDDELAFNHDIYRDYFAAVEIANRSQVEPLLVETLQADPRWEEPLILYSGIAGARTQFVQRIARLNPLLAARSVTSSVEPEQALREIVSQSTESAETINGKALLALTELGDLRRLEHSIKNIRDFSGDVLEALIEILRRASVQWRQATSEDEENGLAVQAGNVIVEALIQKQAADELFTLGCVDLEDLNSTPPLLVRCLEAAAAMGQLTAAYSYGVSLTGQSVFIEHKFGTAVIKNQERLGEAASWLRRAAEGGHIDAMRELSELLFDGNGLDENPAEAECWLRKAAEAQSGVAMLRLGIRLLDGEGLSRKRQEGEEWMRKAAQAGHLDAMHELATRLSEHGHGLAANQNEALKWLLRASEEGHPPAMRDYGLRLLEGDGLAQDVVGGEAWLRKAADAGNPFAVWELTRRLLVGDCLRKNLDEARGWIEKLAHMAIAPWLWGQIDLPVTNLPRNIKSSVQDLVAAAELEHPRAMCILGQRFMEGRGVPKDEQKAEYWLRKAVDFGDDHAAFALAMAFLDGTGLPKSELEGMRFLTLAAEQGFPFAVGVLIGHLAQRIDASPSEVSRWIERGIELGIWTLSCTDCLFKGPRKNSEEAERLLYLAAQAGITTPMAELGRRLLTGDGLAVDLQQGTYWIRKAARLDDVSAMQSLGDELLLGKLIPRDAKEGEHWLRKAVQHGDDEAMNILGCALLDGELLPRNPAEGERWLRKAAHNGHIPAMVNLGHRLLDGVGLSQNSKEGKMWLKKCAEAGFMPACMRLGLLFLDGRKIAKNSSEGEKWLRRAAEAGLPQAMFHLAEYIAEGEIPEREDNEELVWLRKAADTNHGPAIVMLGVRLHAQGQTEEGEEWLRRAISQGEHIAALLFAQCLFNSADGCRFQEAEQWLRHAAKSGVTDAMTELGNRLIEGNGVERNEEEGRGWLRMAADASNKGGHTDDHDTE